MRGKPKSAMKGRINVDQKIKHLLVSITDVKQFLQDNAKLERQFGSKLDEMEDRLIKLPRQKNTLAILLGIEKQFHAIDTQITALAKQKHQRYSFYLHIVVGIKALIFMGAYFRLIPQGSLTRHPSIYIAAAISLFLVWVLYFSLVEKSYEVFFLYTVKPFAEKHPQSKRSIQWTSASIFNLASFSPLMTAVRIFPTFIDPHWDTFFSSVGNIVLQIFTSNTMTALVNILTLLPIATFLYYKVKRKIGKSES